MYAVIKSGGKQYKVSPGDTVRLEKLDAEQGTTVTLEPVLMIANDDQVQIGKPFIEGASVTANIKAQARGPKIEIIKFRRRKHHRKQAGHRQAYTEVEIVSVDEQQAAAGQ